MKTMHPSIMLGSYIWAEDRLPADEFRLRLDNVYQTMDREGWKALLVYGDAREHAALAYLSNFIPRMRWGMALLPRDGSPRVLASMSTRDLPAMRTMTWIGDVHSGWDWPGSFDPWLQQFTGDTPIDFATIGLELMAPPLYESLQKSIGSRFRLRRADEVLSLPPTIKRPRERSQIRASCDIVEAASQSIIDIWQMTGAPERAMLAGERTARAMAAQDVRTLVSLDGGATLMPFQGQFETAPGPMAGYIAVKFMGYWSDMFVTVGQEADNPLQHAHAALDAMINRARAGTAGADLYRAATDALKPYSLHPALSGSVGRAIGLSLEEEPTFHADTSATLQAGGVYSLQTGVAGGVRGHAFASAIIHTTGAGVEVLTRSPSPLNG